MNGWFDVSREGLRQLMEGREKSFVVRELIQNTWDEAGVTHCSVRLRPSEQKGYVELEVADNSPEGFYDLTHAYTLFAKNRKRADKGKRGRFNLGEKQVLALCEEASLLTTKGEIIFNKNGTRTDGSHFTTAGSIFRCRLKMSQADMKRVVAAVKCFIPPAGIETEINGEVIDHRDPVSVAAASLTTEFEHADGGFRRTKRKTTVEIHEVRNNERPTLYEMGIPVVALEGDDKYHYNVMQRVPLNSERDNVTPAFLRDVRAEVVNVVADLLTQDEASSDWAREAAGSDRINDDAFKKVLTARFGDKVTSFSPVDPEANHTAASKGYTVLSGGTLTKGEWQNAKRFEAVDSSAKLFPTPKPGSGEVGDSSLIPESEWTPEMRCVCDFISDLARELVGGIVVRIARAPSNRFDAWYGNREMTLNYSCLGKRFFNEWPTNMERVVALAIHELGHESASDHLSHQYHRALCELAAASVTLALSSPRLFKQRKVRKSRKPAHA